jgi:kojibiose phosphorylase
VQPRWVALCGGLTLDAGQTVTLDKFAALTSSHHVSGSPVDVARKLVWDAAAVGYERLAAESDAVWQERWARTDVVIEGDDASQLALRVSLYHMLRAVVEDDPRCAIDAKAAAGEAYCGRYFWDTELFMLPLFLYTRPDIGKTLARFRCVSLPGARRNAARYGYRGARYAWESAPSGDENCPNWQYADHEIHVTADVAYGLFHAHLVCPDDLRFLQDALEVFLETARYWVDRVTWNAAEHRHELLMVMGPDEYTPFSRNNAYTNRLASFALSLATFAWEQFQRLDPAAAAELGRRLQLQPDELERFAEVAAGLGIPWDEARDLVLQSDDFFDYEPFDFARWWPDRRRRLGATVSQERIYRSQVLKQGDVLQLMALFPHEFTDVQVRTAYDTYEPLTSHDSSLSKSMHAIVALRLGDDATAWRFWHESVGLDLELGEAAEGIHAACAGANWQVAVLGFAGVRTRMQSDVLHLNPRLPAQWTALRFPFVWERQPLSIAITRAAATAPQHIEVQHHGSKPIELNIDGQKLTLQPGQSFP